jgi:hypothetical protein
MTKRGGRPLLFIGREREQLLGIRVSMATQHIGAFLDKVLFIGLGLFMLFVRPKLLWKNPSPEELKKKLKILRICGIILISCGVGSFLLMLF